VPLADGTLVKVPGSGHSDKTLASLLTLSDVMCTWHHAAVYANVKKVDMVAIVGDGAVGLCAIIASKRLGAQRIISLSRNPSRQKVAREFGATDIITERDKEAYESVMGLTDGVGVDASLECVGTNEAMQTALYIARPGSTVSYGVSLMVSRYLLRTYSIVMWVCMVVKHRLDHTCLNFLMIF